MNKNRHIDTENRVMVTTGENGEGKMGEGEQLYGDRWKLNFWWWARCEVYRSRNIVLYTCNLYNV